MAAFEEEGAVFGTDGLLRTNSQGSGDDEIPELQASVLSSSVANWGGGEDSEDKRRMSIPASLVTPQMRSQRLIGNSNPRYRWEQYWKTDEQLKKMKKPIRKYYGAEQLSNPALYVY